MRRVLYVAHALAPTPEEVARFAGSFAGAGSSQVGATRAALRYNIDLALRWLAWLRASFPDDTFIAPWIATVMSLHGDDSPALREAGLRDDCAVVERCDGIVLCGSRISDGMRREREHGSARSHGDWSSWNLTVLGMREPPPVVTGMTLDEWLESQLGLDEERAP